MTSGSVKILLLFAFVIFGTFLFANTAFATIYVNFDQEHYYCETGESLIYIADVYPGLMGPEYTWRFYGFSSFGSLNFTTPPGSFPMVIFSWAFTEPGDHQITVWVRRESDGSEDTDTAWV